MSEQLPDLSARIRVDTDELDRAVRKGAAFGSAFGSLVGNLAGGAISAGIAKVTSFVSGSVDAFAELEDATAAAGVTFGRNVGDITKYAQGAAKQAGISATQATNAALTFGTFGKAAGLTGKDLSGFSTELTQTAADMASFRGTTPEQAIEAVGAALRGETEPIRAYGVLLDDASLRQEAVKQGLISTTKEALTPQQKVLAAHALILKQTSDAQGDFARTSDSTANTQKRLAAETENAQARLGQQLAPAMTFLRTVLLTVIQAISDQLIPGLQHLTSMFSGVVGGGEGVHRIMAVVGAYVTGVLVPIIMRLAHDALAGLRLAWGYISDAIERNRPQLEQLGRVLRDVAQIIVTYVAPIVGQVLKLAFVVLGQAIGTAIDVLAKMVPVIQGVLRVTVPIFAKIAEIALEWAATVIHAAATAFGWVPGLGGKLKAADKAVQEFKDSTVTKLQGMADAARHIGEDVPAGMAAGIRATTGLAVGAAGDMSARVEAIARQTLRTSSPSKVFADIGADVGHGFVQGLVGTEAEVTGTLDDLLAKVKDRGDKLGADVVGSIRRAVGGGRGELVKLAQEAETTRQAFGSIFGATAGVDLTQLGRDDTGAQTADSILGGLHGQVDQAALFAADIARLAALNLNDQAIADLTQRGAAAAGATARALVEGGKAAVTEVNALEAQLAASGVSVAKVGSAAFYDAGQQTAAGLVQGFRSQQSVIDNEMERLANRMQRQIRRALGIHSPSRVFAAIGREVPAGMAAGILDNAGAVDAALARMTPGGSAAAAAGAVGGSSSTWAPSVSVSGTFGADPQQVADAAMAELTWRARLEGAL